MHTFELITTTEIKTVVIEAQSFHVHETGTIVFYVTDNDNYKHSIAAYTDWISVKQR